MTSNLYEVQTMLRNSGILISFSGRLSQGLIEEYGAAVKTYLESEDRPKNAIYNIFSIFIEQTQNIKNYCSSKEGSEYFHTISHSCIVAIGRTDRGNYIWSGNLLENKDVPGLVSRIEHLSSLDKSELKKMYKEQLKSDICTTRGGAGIGLIDIARKALSPLEYSVTPMNETLSFFTLKAVV